MISSACHAIVDTQQTRAGAHLFLAGGQSCDDTHQDRAAGQPFNAGRAIECEKPRRPLPALHPFHAAGQSRSETHRTRASGNLFNGRGQVERDNQPSAAASTFYAVRPVGHRCPFPLRRAAPFHAVCGQVTSDTQDANAANSTRSRRRATRFATPIGTLPAATHTQGDNHV